MLALTTGKCFCYNTVKRIVMSRRPKSATVADAELIRFFVESDDPVLTVMDVAERFDITQQAAHQRLTNLHEDDILNRRKVGGRAVVWWLRNSH